jgi:hypothetical protein
MLNTPVQIYHTVFNGNSFLVDLLTPPIPTERKIRKGSFFLIFIAQTVCTSRSRPYYKVDSLTSLNKYLHYDTNVTEVNINTDVNNANENSKTHTHTLRLSVS